VVLAIATGLVAAGIAGALLSVPLLAVLNAGVRSLLHEGDVDPATVDALHAVPGKPKGKRFWQRKAAEAEEEPESSEDEK
jgi:predicted secreted protein